jgi:predicted MFS family arabinose efflux permease
MTTSSTITPAAPAILSRPSRPHLGLPKLVWALAATHFVGRAGGVVRSFLVLYLTQAQHLSPATAGTVVAAVGVGDIGSQLLGG